MAKYYGRIGFALPDQEETVPGVWVDVIVEHKYYGDVKRNARRDVPVQNLNDDIQAGATIDIMADPYARDHYFAIRYIEWVGRLWKVSNADATNPPRLLLTIGGVYNGSISAEPSDSTGDVDGESD
jgi:hypothetical protein